MSILALVGDIMLGRLVDEEIPLRPPESFWGSTLPVLRSTDAVIGNLECAISARGLAHGRIEKVFAFRARPAATGVLRAGCVRCVSLANNHVLDFGDDALIDTLHHLDAAGIAHAGAGIDLAAAARPATIQAREMKIGFVALTDNEPDFAATDTRPGTFYTPIGTDFSTTSILRQSVNRLRSQGANINVLSAHWGPNMVEFPPPSFRSFARSAIDLGFDIFHGHSAHVFQGVERHGRGVILYDTGDFLDDYAVDSYLRNDWSFIFLLEVDGQGLRHLRTIPVRLQPARVDLAGGEEAQVICQRMIERCAPLGTRLSPANHALELPLCG
jgi:poly-gamma-glutamate synthesis protein (capsule biosynthesis protein)